MYQFSSLVYSSCYSWSDDLMYPLTTLLLKEGKLSVSLALVLYRAIVLFSQGTYFSDCKSSYAAVFMLTKMYLFVR